MNARPRFPVLSWRSRCSTSISFHVMYAHHFPSLQLLIAHTQDQDAYKSAVKRQIREWRASVTQRKQEWLIVHVDGSDTRNTGGFFSMKSSVLERIRADFN